MTAKALSLENVLRIADAWSAAGGLKKIEIGALEPLLWRDGRYKIHDMVSALTNRGFLVSLTTNGQLLELFASELRAAGLSLLRTSWHSMNPVIFREISGGYGDHDSCVALLLRSRQGFRLHSTECCTEVIRTIFLRNSSISRRTGVD